MPKHISRRDFIKATAAGFAAPLILPQLNLHASANGRLQHASVGVGGMGQSDLRAILNSKQADIIAICDIDANNLKTAAEIAPKARLYSDWREMLAAEGDKLDSINVATPDHMHAPIALAALRRNKHVYCQKPLAHELFDVRRMREEAEKRGLVTQMGNQIHSHESYRTAAKILQDGAIGKVKEWHSWSDAPSWPQGLERPEGADPIPAHVAWDLWLGVAPERPFKLDTYHAFKWRGWKDFGSGALGDFGCHIFDPVFMGVNPGPVREVSAEVDGGYLETWPKWEIVRYEFEGSAMTAGRTVKATWYDGGKKPPVELAQMPAGEELPNAGSLVIGEEGTMVLKHWDFPKLYPVEKFAKYVQPKPKDRIDHYTSWVEACLGKGRATSNFSYSGPMTEAVVIGNIANRFPEQTLKWDAEKLKFKHHDPANELVKRSYRAGWEDY